MKEYSLNHSLAQDQVTSEWLSTLWPVFYPLTKPPLQQLNKLQVHGTRFNVKRPACTIISDIQAACNEIN